MLHATTKKSTKKSVRFKGIVTDAKALGVRRETLWRVLTGQWKSKSLLTRYAALKAGKRGVR
jgi:hypothetical protein